MLQSALAPLANLLALVTYAGPEAEEKAPPLIDLDGTVLVQFALFVVMYLILRTFLFAPYLRMRAEREAHIEGTEKKAAELLRKRESLDAEHGQRMQKARAAAEEERLRLQTEGRAREAEVLAQARTSAQARVTEAQQKIAAEVATAQAELERQVEPLARAIFKKVLGREVMS